MTPTSAGIYCRISQDRAGSHLGVDRQRSDCEAWADRHGWTTAKVYTDNDISAFSGKRRPGYSSLLADIAQGVTDGLIVWHPDRLHRSPAELEEFIALVENTGIPVGTVTAGDIDLTTATGRMTARIVGAVARHESDHKRERIQRKHLELAQNGKVPGGGRRPFGYQADRRTLDQAEAAEIRSAAKRVLSGEPIRAIVRDWNDRQLPTVTGAAWDPTTVKRLLRSGRIAGWREHHGTLSAPAEWPAIIDLDEHKKLRAILDDPSRATSPPTNARSYLLGGFVTCGACGATLTARPVIRKGHTYRRYHCLTDRGGCNRVGIGAQPLEELITAAILHRLDTPELASELNERARAPKATHELETLNDLERRQEELAAMFAEGEINRAEWIAARTRLANKLADARSALAAETRTSGAVGTIPTDGLRSAWPAMTLDQRRAILATIIVHITIARTDRRNNRFDPARVAVTWRT